MNKSEKFFEEEGELDENLNTLESFKEGEEETEESHSETSEEEGSKKDENENENEDGDIPFHKHPRFKALVEEKNKYKEELDEFKKEFESKISDLEKSHHETQTNIPDWFTELYGENESAWKKYQEYDKQTRNAIKTEVKEELEREQKSRDENIKKSSDFIEEQIEALKEDGLKFDRNELMKVMYDYKPSDEGGNLDFKKGYKIMELLKKKDPGKVNARKEIGSDGKETKSEPQTKKWFTPDDLRGKGW